MKNVTLTLTEATLLKARVMAAKQGKSLSRFVSEIVESRVGRERTQSEVFDAFVQHGRWTSDGSNLPSREDIYAERLHRHERADLHERRRFAEESGSGGPVGEGPREGE